jgi:lipoprotein signal peptidase
MIPFLSSIIFSLIDSLFFLFGEEKLQYTLDKIPFIDNISAQIITGGISSALSILCFGYVKQYISLHFNIQEHPIIDSIGIIIGTAIIVLLYTLFKNKKNK